MKIRRRLLSLVATWPLAKLLPSVAHAQTASAGAKLKATPQDALGPYYPPRWVGETDADLLTFGGKNYLQGIPLALTGRVLSVDGVPLAGAAVEIWQTDATGKYRHPDDDGEGPAQRGFQGFGRATTQSDGQYRFRTIKPVLYSGRPPHVHFKVTVSGYRELVTQMYFVGDSSERGFSLGFSKARDRLTVTPTASRDGDREGLLARFDLVLERA